MADIDDPIQPVASAAASSGPSAEQIDGLVSFGVGMTPAQARKALRLNVSSQSFVASQAHVQDGNPERAVDWFFTNMDDPGEEEAAAAAPSSGPPTTEQSSSVGGNNNIPANYRLKAFISHKGPSVHSGHYVATIRQPQAGIPGEGEKEDEDEWVLFNDEKVVRAPEGGGEEMRSLAYLYVYERV
jgi:ubiquitin carboxyl-terminal hydrolase 5/13